MSRRPAPDWPLPRVFAHRCGGALAPENTLAGLPIAAALGYAAVEFDVMLSADGTPWVIHDETLERTTDGSGRVCEARDTDLEDVDAGVVHHRAYAGEPLPTLAEVAQACRRLGLMANVEIKPAAGFEAVTGEVVARRVLELWKDAPLPLLSSFSGASLEAARAVSGVLPLGFLWRRVPADWQRHVDALGLYSIHTAWDGLEDGMLGEIRGKQIPVLCYTVNQRRVAESLFRRGVNAVFTDRLDTLSGL